MDLEAKVFGPAQRAAQRALRQLGAEPRHPDRRAGDLARDGDGKILVDHFYDDVVPPSAADLAAARALPPDRGRAAQEAAAQHDGSRQRAARRADHAPRAQPPRHPRRAGGRAVDQRHPHRSNGDVRLSSRAEADAGAHPRDRRVVPDEAWLVHRPRGSRRRRSGSAHARVVQLSWGGGYPAVPDGRSTIRSA